MGKNIKITEEQYKQIVKEGVVLKANVQGTNGDVTQAINNTKSEAQKNGVNLKDATIEIDGKDINNESVLLTKKQLVEMQLKKMKKNSRTLKVSEFMEKIK